MGTVRKASRVRDAASALAALTMFAISAAQASDPELFVHNRTGVDIKALYVSPSGAADWRTDVLEGEPLLDGDDTAISVPRALSAAKWDLKLVDREGASQIWPGIDVEKNSEVTLRLTRGRPYVETVEE